MTQTFDLPVVGTFHHPPAAALVRILPLNANLWLRSKPDNSFDSNAIAIDLDFDLLNLNHRVELRSEIKATFDNYKSRHPDGPEFDDILQVGLFHLGYLSAIEALRIKTDFPNFVRTSGVFRIGPKAKPFVRFTLGGL